jgi:hypothetical protein
MSAFTLDSIAAVPPLPAAPSVNHLRNWLKGKPCANTRRKDGFSRKPLADNGLEKRSIELEVVFTRIGKLYGVSIDGDGGWSLERICTVV